MYVKNCTNRITYHVEHQRFNVPTGSKLKSKTEIHLRLCFATLPLVPAFGLLLLPILLPSERLVIN